MREYIVNLTNNLIGKNHYDEIFRRRGNKGEFLTRVKFDLDSGDVHNMTPETLGKIMCAFEIGDVLSAHPGKEVTFSGDCEELLREIVSICLAYVIRSRLNGQSMIPYPQISGFKYRKVIDREVPFFTPAQIKTALDEQNKER